MSVVLYGIGIGPGDPELITIKAKRVLEDVPVIAAPISRRGGKSIALEITKKLIDMRKKHILMLHFPMKKEKEILAEYWKRAKRNLLAELRRGKDVAFITIGDPLFHSTFIYLMDIGRDDDWVREDFYIKVIPGVSSINASTASAMVPLAHAHESVAMLPATYKPERLMEILRDFDTVVLMKVHRSMDKILPILEELDLIDRAFFISRAGWPEEKVVKDIMSLSGKKLDYFSMIIVRKESEI